MSTLKEAFEAFWRRRYGLAAPSSGAASPQSVPTLDCFDCHGQATVDAVQRSLDECRKRMAELRMKIRDEEYLEEFFCGVLRDGLAAHLSSTDAAAVNDNHVIEKTERTKSHTIFPHTGDTAEGKSQLSASKLRATIAERRLLFEDLSRNPDVDGGGVASIKKKPKTFAKKSSVPKGNSILEENTADDRTEKDVSVSRPSDASVSPANQRCEIMNSNENISCENGAVAIHDATAVGVALSVNGVDVDGTTANQEMANDSSCSEVFATSKDSDDCSTEKSSPSSSIRRKNRAPSNESTSTANTEDDNSDDEVSNLLALRQSVTFANKWCEGVDSSRSRLEEQAQRLSRRFTQIAHGKNADISKILELEAVAEMPASPTPSFVSEQQEHVSVGDADWVPPTALLLPAVMDIGVTHEESSGIQLLPEKGEMRRWVVMSLLESEKMYMEVLDSLINYKQMFKNFAGTPNVVVTLTEVETIFYRVSDLHKIHYQFVRDLEPIVLKWSSEQRVAEIFKVLAMEEYGIAPEYLRNYSKALSTIHLCRSASPQFDQLTKEISFKSSSGMEKTTLEDLLHKPIVRFQRNTLLLHDLIKYTPTSHLDYDLLQKTLKFARRFLDDLENSESNKDNPENQRYLARHGLIVEKVNKMRKLRHIFLFNDVIIAAKQKPPGRNRVQYEVKWFMPLTDLSLEDKVGLKDDVILEQDLRDEVALLQRKISELQAEHKAELKKAKQAAESAKIKMRKTATNKNIERIRKKLMEQEAALVIASPSLVFRLYNPRAHKQFLLMMSSDYERTDWRDAITGLLFKAPAPAQVTAVDVQNLVNKQKLANLRTTGVPSERDSIFMEEERLYGSLHVRVGQLQGLRRATCAVCHIEVDSFGHFSLKAKTNSTAESVDPAWNEDFEIDLDGAQTLRVLCYHRSKDMDQLFGKGALELRSVWLKDGADEDCVISINNEMSVSVNLQYTSRDKAIPRCLSTFADGLFGIRLDIITAREKVAIPIVVTSCVEEIEKRGVSEEGIYRVSGLFDTVQTLQNAFEKNSAQAVLLLKTVDVNSLTGLIKLFFRKLPESLFTDALYKNLQEGIGLADPDARDRCLVSLFGTLPEPNFSTALFLLDHLIRVAKHEEVNKMTLKNLATIFGPTLLRPAARNSQTQTMEQLFFLSAHEAMMQTTILLHLMTIRASGIEFKCSPI